MRHRRHDGGGACDDRRRRRHFQQPSVGSSGGGYYYQQIYSAASLDQTTGINQPTFHNVLSPATTSPLSDVFTIYLSTSTAAIPTFVLSIALAVAEQRLLVLLVAPMRLGLFHGLAHLHLVVDLIDPARRDLVMPPAGVGVFLGRQDAVAAHLVDRADMRAVGTDHFHMFAHFGKRSALRLALIAPAAEFVFELAAVFLAIFVIIAVERIDLASAPPMIIVVAAIATLRVPPVAQMVGVLRIARAELFAWRPVP